MAEPLNLIIAGAGPAGLAAAIAAKTRGLTYRVFEKGTLVNSLVHYPVGMVFFTTPELMEIGGLPFVTTPAQLWVVAVMLGMAPAHTIIDAVNGSESRRTAPDGTSNSGR